MLVSLLVSSLTTTVLDRSSAATGGHIFGVAGSKVKAIKGSKTLNWHREVQLVLFCTEPWGPSNGLNLLDLKLTSLPSGVF